MQKTIRWHKNLKKWQKGGLIGLAIGIVFAGLIILSPHHPYGRPPGVWIYYFHMVPFAISDIIMDVIDRIKDTHVNISYVFQPTVAFLCLGLGIIVIGYEGFGAVVGRVQQVANHRIRWLITGLLALFLLFIYWLNFLVAMWFRYL